MSDVHVEASVGKQGDSQQSTVTATVTNSDPSRPVTAEDALSVGLVVSPPDGETQLEFFRDVGDLAPGTSWDHTWTIQGEVLSADLTVRDSAGTVLANAAC